jgi:hypothetical protein
MSHAFLFAILSAWILHSDCGDSLPDPASTRIRPEVRQLFVLIVRIAIWLADLARSVAGLEGVQLNLEQLAIRPDLFAVFAIPAMIDAIARFPKSANIETAHLS